jgi:hypothetical protein
MSTTQDVLAARYGRPSGSRRTVIVAVGIGIAAIVFIGWAGAFAVRTGNRPVTWDLAGATVVSATRTDVAFDLTMRRTGAALCRVRVMNSRATVVGWTDIRITASGTGSPQRAVVSVSTAERGMQGNIQSCLEQ